MERVRALLAARRPGDESPLPEVKAPAELQPLLKTIEQLLERLQAAIVRERRFTDNAAHELRTPLTGVKTHIQVARLASQRQNEGATLEAALVNADAGVQQLESILQRLLELARLDAEAVEADSSDPVEATHAAMEALEILHGHAARKVQILGVATSRPVRVARPLLVAALQNLIDNAMRYAPSTTPVIVRLEPQDDGMMAISVVDQGPGMDEAERSQAVTRFWRA